MADFIKAINLEDCRSLIAENKNAIQNARIVLEIQDDFINELDADTLRFLAQINIIWNPDGASGYRDQISRMASNVDLLYFIYNLKCPSSPMVFNKNCPSEILDSIAGSTINAFQIKKEEVEPYGYKNLEILDGIAKNKNTTDSTFEKLLQIAELKPYLASNPRTPLQYLKLWSRVDNPYITQNILLNPILPEEILNFMVEHSPYYTSFNFWDSPQFSHNTLRLHYQRGGIDFDRRQSISNIVINKIKNKELSDKMLNVVRKKGFWDENAVLLKQTPNMSDEHLLEIISNPNYNGDRWLNFMKNQTTCSSEVLYQLASTAFGPKTSLTFSARGQGLMSTGIKVLMNHKNVNIETLKLIVINENRLNVRTELYEEMKIIKNRIEFAETEELRKQKAEQEKLNPPPASTNVNNQNQRTSGNTQNRQVPKSSSPCYIATAAYGSPYSIEVDTFRYFRDTVLVKSWFGRAFIAFYYKTSPPLADFIAEREYLKAATRKWLLAPLLHFLRKK
jgi:hypothetical protein